MKLFQLPIALALLRTVTTHTVYTTLFTDGADQGDGTCIRMPMTQNNFTDPIKDLMSSDMACGFGGNAGAALASKNCFEQSTACYATAPPTSFENCHIWGNKCDGIRSGGDAGNFNSPPDQGAILNPPITTAYQSIAPAVPETVGVYSNIVSVTYYPVGPPDRLYSTVVSVATVAPPTSTEVFLTEVGLPNTSTSSTGLSFTPAFEELPTTVTSPTAIGSPSTSTSSIDATSTSPIVIGPSSTSTSPTDATTTSLTVTGPPSTSVSSIDATITSPMATYPSSTSVSSIDATIISPMATYPSSTFMSTIDSAIMSSSVPSSLSTMLSDTDTEDISSLLTGPSITRLATIVASTSADLLPTTGDISVTTSSNTSLSSTDTENIYSSVANYLSTSLITADTVATSSPKISISTTMNLVTVKTSTTVSTTLLFAVPATAIATKVVIEYPLTMASSALSDPDSILSTVVAPTPSPPAPVHVNSSLDGRCGKLYNQTCQGSSHGYCCSQEGFCGDRINYCGIGCQAAYGNCSVNGSSDGKIKPRNFHNHR